MSVCVGYILLLLRKWDACRCSRLRARNLQILEHYCSLYPSHFLFSLPPPHYFTVSVSTASFSTPKYCLTWTTVLLFFCAAEVFFILKKESYISRFEDHQTQLHYKTLRFATKETIYDGFNYSLFDCKRGVFLKCLKSGFGACFESAYQDTDKKTDHRAIPSYRDYGKQRKKCVHKLYNASMSQNVLKIKKCFSLILYIGFLRSHNFQELRREREIPPSLLAKYGKNAKSSSLDNGTQRQRRLFLNFYWGFTSLARDCFTRCIFYAFKK